MPETSLLTDRLELVASTLEHVEAELLAPEALGALLGVTVSDGWPPGEYDRGAQEYFRDRLRTAGPDEAGWLGWYALTRDRLGRRGALVACGGYLGPPVSGSVEIGYSVLPSARGLGYAKELVQALVGRAFRDPRVREVIAHTAQSNAASLKVLLGCGFQPEGPDPDAEALRFRRKRS